MFPAVPYLEWIDGRPAAATYDLGSSDLSRHDETSGAIPAPLRDCPDPDTDTPLRALVAEAYDVDEESVLVTAGATHANFVAVAAALGVATGTQVLVETPGYGPLSATPDALGADVGPLVRPSETEYTVDPERLDTAADESFAAAVVTNRHNPSGRLLSRSSLERLGSVASAHDGYLVVDEVYAPYVVQGADGRAFGGPTGAGLPGVLVTGSLTKFYGLGGLRIGWLVGPPTLLDEARRVDQHLGPVATPSVRLARRAFAHRESLSAASRSLLGENHRLLSEFVANRDDLSGDVYDGSSFTLVAHDRADGDAVSAAAWERGILVVPGRFFGRPEAFRLSLGREPSEMAAGLEVLSAVLDDL